MGLTDLLDQIDRLDNEATKGPWEKLGSTVESNGTYEDVITTEVDCSSYCYGGRGGGVLKDKDAEFIALARTALPQLAKALRGVLDAIDNYAIPRKQDDPTNFTLNSLEALEANIRETIIDALEENAE